MGFLNGHLTTGGLGGLTWVSGQAYNQNDIVQHLGILYRVKLAHTSATAPASDTTNYEIANLSSSTLFLDAVNSRVGVGTNSPIGKLTVKDATDSVTSVVLIGDTDNTRYTAYGPVNPGYQGFGFSGTFNAPTASGAASTLVTLGGRGHNGTSFTGTKSAISINADSLWTGISNATNMTFSTTATNSTTPVERLRIDPSGNLLVGGGVTAVGGGDTLRIHASKNADQLMTLRNTHASGVSAIRLEDETGAYHGFIGQDNANNDVRVFAVNEPLLLGSNSDAVTIVSANSERMRIDASGNVGIGAISVSAKLHIQGGGNVNNNNAAILGNANRSTAIRIIDDQNASQCGGFIEFGGLTGTTGAGIKYAHVSGGGNTTGNLTFCTRTNTTDSNLTVQMVIYSNGQIGFSQLNWGTGGAAVGISGNVLTTSPSSKRYKENITPLTNLDTSKIYNLIVQEFDYIQSKGGQHSFGGIAEDVAQVLPQIVHYEEIDGERKPESISETKIVWLLLEEMKKLKARIEVLETK